MARSALPQQDHSGQARHLRAIGTTKQLTSRIAHILYYDGHQPGDGHTGFRYGDLHRDFEVGTLLAQYEPGAQSDPQQLKVILDHLRPQVKTGEAAVVGLYNFFKTFLALRKAWLKAAGEFYSLLAYIDMCKRWGLYGGGPSFPGTFGSELLQSQLVKTQEHFETTYSGLQTFKSSSTFTQNMRQLLAYYEKMKAYEEQRQKHNNEAMMKAKEDEKKRTTIKQRNERVLVRQMGPIDGEMGDAL